LAGARFAAAFLAGAFLAGAFFAAAFLAGAFLAGAGPPPGDIRDTIDSSWPSRSSTRLASHPSCLVTSCCTASAKARPRSSIVCTACSVSERRIAPALTSFFTVASACWRVISPNWALASSSFCREFLAIGRC
jgi:hypothetical protein